MKKFLIYFIISIILLAILQRVLSNDRKKRELSKNQPVVNYRQNKKSIPEHKGLPKRVFENEKEEKVESENTEIELAKVPKGIPSQILKRIAYTVSYNYKTKCPNWVAWHLTENHTKEIFSRRDAPYRNGYNTYYGIDSLSGINRRGNYFMDMECEIARQDLMDWPNNEYQMTHGHMCPAADCKWSKTAMNQSFLLSNMCPQTDYLNSNSWTTLENSCRMWAQKYGDIYITTGPIFKNGIKRTIGEGKIAVPDEFFKVVLCLQGTPKAIGFIYQNDDNPQEMHKNARSVDEIERITNFDFFNSLPDNIENEVEAKFDYKEW